MSRQMPSCFMQRPRRSSLTFCSVWKLMFWQTCSMQLRASCPRAENQKLFCSWPFPAAMCFRMSSSCPCSFTAFCSALRRLIMDSSLPFSCANRAISLPRLPSNAAIPSWYPLPARSTPAAPTKNEAPGPRSLPSPTLGAKDCVTSTLRTTPPASAADPRGAASAAEPRAMPMGASPDMPKMWVPMLSLPAAVALPEGRPAAPSQQEEALPIFDLVLEGDLFLWRVPIAL
mmetsp:Transcript_8517/g.20577  ORF Transcript_8517/g.20577 Transcript_8517/m.20577 type:complete len:230 (-) Transcript_8517:158-847(-)